MSFSCLLFIQLDRLTDHCSDLFAIMFLQRHHIKHCGVFLILPFESLQTWWCLRCSFYQSSVFRGGAGVKQMLIFKADIKIHSTV